MHTLPEAVSEPGLLLLAHGTGLWLAFVSLASSVPHCFSLKIYTVCQKTLGPATVATSMTVGFRYGCGPYKYGQWQFPDLPWEYEGWESWEIH